MPINAVQVTTRRDATNSNSLPSVFAGIVGIDNFDITRTAAAVNGAGVEFPCVGGGILSLKEAIAQSDIDWNGFCVYGEDDRVEISGSNNVNEGTIFAMPDEDNYAESQDNVYDDFDNQVISDTWALPTLDLIDDFIADLENEILPPGIPFSINTVVEIEKIDSADFVFNANTLYIVEKDVTLQSNSSFSDFAVVVGEDITMASNSTIENVVLMSNQKITFQSNNRIGFDQPCNTPTGQFGVYVFAEDNVEFMSNNEIYGVQVATNKELKVESNNVVVGLYAEARERASMQSNSTYGSCGSGLGSAFGPLTGAMVPGDLKLVPVD